MMSSMQWKTKVHHLIRKFALGQHSGALGPSCHCSELAAGSVLIFSSWRDHWTIYIGLFPLWECKVFRVARDDQRKTKRVTPRCHSGSVASERNSFCELNLQQSCKVVFVDCDIKVSFCEKQISHSKAPDLIYRFFWRKTSPPPSLIVYCLQHPIIPDYSGVPGSSCKGCASPSERNAVDNREQPLFSTMVSSRSKS